MAVDWHFISDLEGGQQLTGYVPDPTGSMSGVTVATGVDLGQMSSSQIDNLGISDDLKARLKPYAGLKGQAAVDFLASNPLTISQPDADSLDQAVEASTLSQLKANYDGAAGAGAWDGLPDQAQTVIMSVATQYGSGLATATPHFWALVTAMNWAGAVSELRNFHDDYPTRRNKEADLLQQIVPST